MNNKAIQILRGAVDYDPSNVNNQELLDGQPFYSKQNKQLYIGDKSYYISTGKDANGQDIIDSYITRPIGASWIKPGEGVGSFVSACLVDENGNAYESYKLPTVSGHESIAFGMANKVYGNKDVAFGSWNTVYGNNSIISGHLNSVGSADVQACNNNIASGVKNKIYGSNNIITGAPTTEISRYEENNTIFGNNNIVIGEENKVGKSTKSVYNNIIVGEANESTINNSYLFGHDLKSTNNDNKLKLAVGYYNADISNALFEIGNGISAEDPGSCFYVTDQGAAYISNTAAIGNSSANDGNLYVYGSVTITGDPNNKGFIANKSKFLFTSSEALKNSDGYSVPEVEINKNGGDSFFRNTQNVRLEVLHPDKKDTGQNPIVQAYIELNNDKDLGRLKLHSDNIISASAPNFQVDADNVHISYVLSTYSDDSDFTITIFPNN